MAGRHLRVLAFVAGTCLLANGAAAQPTPPAAVATSAAGSDKKEQAKTRFTRGLDLAAHAHWDAAYAEFVASRELYPTRVASQDAAVCLRELGRLGEALDAYEDLLRDYAGSLPEDERRRTVDAVRELRSAVGEIVLTSDPPGSVVLDGEERATPPTSHGLRVSPGSHSIRVYRAGYVPFAGQVVVAGGQVRKVAITLQPLERSGQLLIAEADGRSLDVVIDGAVVGRSPWAGRIGLGVHAVALRGDGDLGTAPSAVAVSEDRATSLTLRATTLDADVRIEPTPSNARVDIDGVTVGNGVWGGRLGRGAHRLEIVAEGFADYRKDIVLANAYRETLRVTLDRATLIATAGEAKGVRATLDASIGFVMAPGFGGSADAACSRGECSKSGLASGALVGARAGYVVANRLALELFAGYFTASRSTIRRVSARGEQGQSFAAQDERDSIHLGGPLALVSASYHFFETTPLLFRFGVGALRASAQSTNDGHFSGLVASRLNPSDVVTVAGELAIPEKTEGVWIPALAPEVRFGYRVTTNLVVDLGATLLIGFATPTLRSGTSSSDDGVRRGTLPDVPGGFRDGSDVRPGFVTLPAESSTGTFFAVIPSISIRYEVD